MTPTSPRGRGSARKWSEGQWVAVEINGDVQYTTHTELPTPLCVGLLSGVAVTAEHRRPARFLRAGCRKAGLYGRP